MPITSDSILEELQLIGDRSRAEWWNRYMKEEIPFLGARIPDIRKILLKMDRNGELSGLPLNRQVGLVNRLMKGTYAEEKLAAILFMQLFWLGKQKNVLMTGLISDWFDERYIFDWNTTDWLCVRILTPMLEEGDEKVIRKLKRWNRDPYLWKARASLVPFTQASNIADYGKEITRFSDILIRREERFAKTAVGWVMREYSRHDVEFVLSFLSRHVKYITAEVKRNALKYYRQYLHRV
jgi:3-methyladenine DNA glycosylase AlkD